uniref:Uncharacterized protein n=1 Tax=viral metagenome TaxID=1070528 RepID=A0A6M3IH54_9ZZZZ
MPRSTPIDPKVSAQIESLQERAKSAQEMRRSAPAVDAAGFVTVPQKDIINRVARTEGGQDGKWHYTFQDKNLLDELADKGYEPALDPNTGKWIWYHGDPLMKIPTDLFELSLKENSARSAALLGSKFKNDRRATGENVRVKKGDKELFAAEDGGDPQPSSMKQE